MADILDPSTWSFPSLGSSTPETKTTPKTDRLGYDARERSLDAFLAGPVRQPAPAQAVTTPKTDRLLSEAEKLAADLAQINAANSNPDAMALFTLSNDRGNGLTAENRIVKDYRDLTAVQFQKRYGQDIYDKMVATGIGGNHVRDLEASERDLGEIARDTGVDMLSGAAQSLLGANDFFLRGAFAGSLGDYLLRKNAELSTATQEFTDSLKTREDKRLDYVDALRGELDRIDNEGALRSDQADDSGLVDSMRSYGRDVLRTGGDAVKRIVEDPSRLGSSVSEGVGSLVAGGALSKGVASAASAGNRLVNPGLTRLGANTAEEAIRKAAFPLTIGAMEGGSVSNQTIQEIMAIPEEELQKLDAYQELIASGMDTVEARNTLAARASGVALPLAAGVGAVTGKLVSRFEQNPLSGAARGGLIGNTGREFVEEGLQSAAGEIAGNVGTRVSGVDPDNNLVEGVGQATVEGALAGAGTPGAIQGPGLVLKQAAKAAGATLRYPVDMAKKRGERILAANAAESTVSKESLAPAVEAATEQASAVAESLRAVAQENGAKGEEVETYITKVEQASQTTEEELAMLPDSMGPEMTAIVQETGRLPNRFETLTVAAAAAMDESRPQEDRVSAATFILKHIENNKKLFTEDYPAFLDNVPHDRDEFKAFEGYAGILTAIAQTPAIQQALKWAREEMQQPDQDLTGVDLNSDQGQKIVANTVNVATVAPHAVNPKVAEQILFQADSGTLELSPEHRRIIRSATALLNSARLYAAQQRVVEPGVLEEQAAELQQELEATENRDEIMEFIGRQIETEGGAKAHQTSLRDHVAGINLAVDQGDMKMAARKARRLKMFAMSHINKVGAINKSIQNGDGRNVSYKALSSSDEFYVDKKGVGVRVGNAGSERFGRKVHAEAMAIAQLANDIAQQYPEFGISTVEVPALLLDQAQEGQDTKRGSSTPAEPSAPSQATTSRTDTDTVQQEELPLPPSQPTREPEIVSSAEEDDVPDSTDQAEISSSEPAQSPEITPEIEAPAAEIIAEAVSEPVADQPETEESAEVSSDTPVKLSDQDLTEFVGNDDDTGQTIQEAYSSLVQPNGNNWFHKAFRLPRAATSRLAGLSRPIPELKEMLNRSASLIRFIGRNELRYEVSKDDAVGFQQLLDLGEAALRHVNERLAAKQNKDKLLEKIASGADNMIRTRDLRVLNLLEKTDRGYRYHPQLIQSAAVAALDWALNISQRSAPLDVKDVAKIMGVDEADASPFVAEFNRGMSLDIAKRSLGEHIRKFWGVEANKSARDGFTKGIPEAVAAELLHGLESAGLLELRIKKADSDNRLKFPNLTEKTFNRVWFDTRSDEIKKLVNSLNDTHDLLADLALIDREIEGYSIGEPVTDIDHAQLRNPMVKLSRQQKRTLENVQKTPYYANQVVFDFYSAMGEEAYVSLMSGRPYKQGDLDKTHQQMGLNKTHWESIKGRQRGLVADYQNVAKQMAAVKKHGADAPTFYRHHINKLGRTQMDGASNPQASKYAREIFMPTRTTLDLSGDAPDMDKFLMTVGQGIGLKTEKLTRSEVMFTVMEKTMAEGGEFYPLVQELKIWLENRENGKGKDLPFSTYELLQKHGLSDHGIHSLLAVARYELAVDRGAPLNAFETFNYLEADGKTNGPINALMTMASGAITVDWLKAVAKGGAFFGKLGKTLNSHDDKVDLYEESATKTQLNVADLGQQLKDSPEAHKLFLSFLKIMKSLNADVLVDENGEISLIKRGLTKNPLTITIYGSGAKGIAGKITDELATAIFEKLSESIQTGTPAGDLIYGEGNATDFMSDLTELTSRTIRQDRKTGEYHVVGKSNPLTGSAQDFELNREQYQTLRSNVGRFLVAPMRAAINDKVTRHVAPVTTAIQKATQIQSIILKGMFITEVAKRIALMKSDPDKYDYVDGEFLSENELNEIRDNLRRFSPIIDTGSQGYMLSGGETADLFDKTTVDIDGESIEVAYPEAFSGSLSNDMRTPAYVNGPTLAGVGSIPTLVVGSGDGQMMLNFLAGNPEAAKRVLHVYDGLNMPADAIDDYSRLVNQAVFKTWTSDKNPVRAVQESFAAFVQAAPLDALFSTDETNPQQSQALLEMSRVALDRFDVKDEDVIQVSDIQDLMQQVLGDLNRLADETDVRRQVYSEFALSVDQMASGESPFVNEGSIQIAENASEQEVVDAMQARYLELLGEKYSNTSVPIRTEVLKPAEKAVESSSHTLRTFIRERAMLDADTGAQVLNVRQFADLSSALPKKSTETQREVLEAAVEHLRKENYLLVFGGRAKLDAWEQVYNADRFIPGSNNHYGKIDPISKIILISNISVETLTHELIHAATIDKVRGAFSNPSALSKEDLGAVARIEGLMKEWLVQDFGEESDTTQDAHRQAKATVEGYRSKGRRAEAVNEFMAWVLGNQHLSKVAGKTKVQNPLFRIIGDALSALKQLVFGTRKSLEVADDMLSNLRFDTHVLMATPTPIELLKQDFAETALYQSPSFGSDPRLTELRQKFNARVVSWMNEGGKDLASHHQRVMRQKDVDAVRKAGADVARSFAAHFPGLGNMQAYSTFAAIQAALMTEIELNPNALSRMEELYSHVIRTIKREDFQVDRDGNDPNDVYQAQKKYDALQGLYINRTDKQGRSSLMSSFLALAMTDNGFRKILSTMEKPKADRDESRTLDAMLENTANASLDRLSLILAGEKSSDTHVRDALDRLTQAMIENVGDQRSFIEQRTEGYIEQAENAVADKIQDVSARVAEKTADVVRTSNSRTVKAGATLVNVFATMVNEQKSTDAALGMVSWLNRREGFKTLRDTVTNIIGRNRENSLIFDMISKVRAEVQQVRQNFRDELPVKLSREFSKAPSSAQWTAMFKSLGKTDLAALTSTFGVDGAIDLVMDPNKVAAEIQTLEQSLQNADRSRFARVQAKSKQLAHYMMTGEQGVKLLRNAEAISRLLGERGLALAKSPTPQYVESVDRLVSLYALQQLDQATRDEISQLNQNEKDRAGLEFVTSYLVGQRVDELGKMGSNQVARLNHYKGHIPSEAQQGGSLIIASDTEHGHLVSRGYSRIDAYHGSTADRMRGRRSYYFAPVSGLAPFSQGVLQTVHQTASGIDPETGYTVGEVMAGRIEDAQIVRLIERQLSNQSQTRENLLPVYNENGKLVAFERAADVSKLSGLNRSTDLSKMIGVWRGRQAEEMLAQEVNKELVDNLHEIWERDRAAGKANEFVNIAKLNASRDDRILIEAAGLIPNQARDYIKSVFGPEEFWVRRDMLLDTFGARQASVGDLFTGKTRWNPKVTSEFEKLAVGVFGKYAYVGMVGAEKNVQELVANAKNLIVVKSVVVPAANLISNMFQLLNRGVPLRNVLKGVPAKTVEINAYIKSRNREIDLEADLRAARGKNDLVAIRRLENEIRSLQDSYRRMSIWPLIEAGEFSAISNGQVTAEDLALADGKWTNWVERKVSELPDGIRTGVRYGLVTRDTALFQGLARAVQYGDFVAKAILYDDLVKRKARGKKEAIATVNEAFVNYNRLAGRSRQYLESVGLLWFWNYKLRIMKEAVYTLRHNPLRSLLMTVVPVGSPISDNFLTVLLEDRLGWSIGPSMGWNSISLNPWINAVR